MIATLRALAVLTAVAIASIVVAIVAPGERAPIDAIDRRISPNLAADAIDRVRWTRPDGAIEIVRHGRTWQWVGRNVAVDTGAVDDFIAALRGGSWQRTDVASRAGATHATVIATASASGASISFAIGEPLAGTAQVWVVSRDRALLVDGWIAHALDPGRLALRVSHPFAHVREASIEISFADHHVALSTSPRRQGGVIVDAARVDALDTALADLALTSDTDPTSIALSYPRIGFGKPIDDMLTPLGHAACGEEIHSRTASGCVGADGWAAVTAAIAQLDQPVAAIADRRPWPLGRIAEIQLPDGTIDLAKRPTIDGNGADSQRVAELVAALGAPARVVAAPTDRPGGTIIIHDATGAVLALDLHAGVVARRGESIGLAVEPAAWAAFVRPATSYRDEALWVEEPTAVVAITVDAVTYTSGTIVGRWTREPPGPIDPAAIDAAAQLLAAVRAPAVAPPTDFTPRHKIAITAASPSGPANMHTLEIGDGCVARAGDRTVKLPPPICNLVRLGS